MRFVNVVLVSIFSFVFLAGCVQKEDIIAQVGGEKITTENFSERLMSTPPAYQAYINTEPGRKQFADLLIREKLILESAKQAGVAKREDYKKAVANFKEEQKKQFKEYEDGIMMEMYIKEIQKNSITASDSEIEKYYEENKNDFEKPVAVTARHILVPSKEEAQKALDRIKSGESFEKVAKEASTDKISAERGGLIGPFKKGELVKEFEDAVFKLKKGEVSDIVETPFGMHIIMKVSEQNLPPVSKDEAKAEIKKILEKNKFEKWFEDAKKKFNVHVDYSKLDNLQNTGNEEAAAANNQQEEPLGEFSN
ncbi:MAG: peptidylprolyl isomerase [Endomicrobiaceae bacterium]|nr:peptidylprolyl isomerase [Endomicrobiaceae bacterium]